MKDAIERFKTIVRENFSKEDFAYHEWMNEYHLDIVERIALELCDFYPEADKSLVQTLVWFHDFGKPLDEENERTVTLAEGPKALEECGFTPEFIKKVIEYWKLMEQKNEIDIGTTPIEVRIVSSADGASHFTGVFYSSYFRDDINEPFSEIQKRVQSKIEQDWNRKIVLPEARKAIEKRYQYARELFGDFPEKFI